MLTKTKQIKSKKSGFEENHSFSIPEDIQKIIDKRGFYMYEWIGTDDVRNSLELDFLKLIKNSGKILSTIIIAIALITYIFFPGLFLNTIFIVFLILNASFILFLFILGIKRSNVLRKNFLVFITNSHISINGKIRKIKDKKILSNENIEKIASTFEEKLFSKSLLKERKKKTFKEVKKDIKGGFLKILKSFGRGNSSKGKGQILLLVLGLYLAYTLSISFIYIIGIFFIWLFGILLSFLNKQILLISGHKITSINYLFEKMTDSSIAISNQKDKLSSLLKQAIKNKWQDSLLTKINFHIEKLNSYTKKAIKTNTKLKKEITNSKYKEMFDFSIYNSWIKKEITEPLRQIVLLLETNLEKLNTQKENIEKQILNTKDISLKAPLEASKKRIVMRIGQIEKYYKNINYYINKLS